MNHLGCFEAGTRDTPSQSPAILWVAGARRFRALPSLSEERPSYRRAIRPKVRKSESPKVRKSESPKVRKSESPKVRKSGSPKVRKCPDFGRPDLRTRRLADLQTCRLADLQTCSRPPLPANRNRQPSSAAGSCAGIEGRSVAKAQRHRTFECAFNFDSRSPSDAKEPLLARRTPLICAAFAQVKHHTLCGAFTLIGQVRLTAPTTDTFGHRHHALKRHAIRHKPIC